MQTEVEDVIINIISVITDSKKVQVKFLSMPWRYKEEVVLQL